MQQIIHFTSNNDQHIKTVNYKTEIKHNPKDEYLSLNQLINQLKLLNPLLKNFKFK